MAPADKNTAKTSEHERSIFPDQTGVSANVGMRYLPGQIQANFNNSVP